MAKEVLYIPEDHLGEYIAVIRAGLAARPNTSDRVRQALTRWCDEEEDYLQGG